MKLVLTVVFTVAVFVGSIISELETFSDGVRQLHFIGTADGKSFFYDNASENYVGWKAAAAYCASTGMHLASLDTKAQHDLIANSADDAFIKAHYFWTSARDSHDITQFKWNDTNASAASASTYINITDYIDLDHLTCLRLHKYSVRLGFSIVGCEYDLNFPLCET